MDTERWLWLEMLSFYSSKLFISLKISEKSRFQKPVEFGNHTKKAQSM